MAEPLLEISSLSHAYGDRRALVDLSLSVAPGEILGMLGPNGSGKTTLFRILCTLVSPQSGTVVYHLPEPLDLARRPDRLAIRQRIGVVFQNPSLDKQLTAGENLRHHGHLHGLTGRELAERINLLLDRFGLADRRRELVGTFSGGMCRRVELAKGLLNRPRILLLDEPSTGLDPAARLDLWSYLLEIRQSEQVTVLLTTHLMEEADKCDRIAIMDEGRLVACDTPAALKERIGGDVITLASRDPAALRAALAERLHIEPLWCGLPACTGAIEGAVRIERPRGHEFIPTLVETLPGLIESVSLSKPTLEDVFIHATGHQFRDADGPP